MSIVVLNHKLQTDSDFFEEETEVEREEIQFKLPKTY